MTFGFSKYTGCIFCFMWQGFEMFIAVLLFFIFSLPGFFCMIPF